MEPLHYARIFRRRVRLILATTVVGALLGLASTGLVSTGSSAQQRFLAAHVLLDESTPDQPLNLSRVETFLTVGEVPQSVARDVGTDPFDVTARTRVAVDGTSRTITLYAVASSSADAEALAGALADRGVTFLVEKERENLDAELDLLEDQRGSAQAELERQQEAAASSTEGGEEVPEAQQRAITDLQDRIAQFDGEIAGLVAAQTPSERLSTISEATGFPVSETQIAGLFDGPPGERAPVQLRPTVVSDTNIADGAAVRTTGGALAGLLGGLSLAVILARLDPRIRTKEEAEAAFGLPVLAEIPSLPREQRASTTVAAMTAPRSPTAEAYRAVRSSLVFVSHQEPFDRSGDATSDPPTFENLVPIDPPAGPDRRAQTIMVTSPGPGEGKTTSTANLAAVLAEAGFSVLAINCDFRKPRIHRYLGADDTPKRVAETSIPRVRLISDVVSDSSRLNPAEVVAAQRQVIAAARSLFDIILLDTAPMLTTNDAVDVLAEVDLVVVCCRAGSTTREAGQRTIEALRRHEAPVAGCVLVGAEEAPSAKYYYYYGTDGQESRNGGSSDASPDPGARGATSPFDLDVTPSAASVEDEHDGRGADTDDRRPTAPVADDRPRAT